MVRIDQKVTKKSKVFRKHLQLRDPISGTIYDFLMELDKVLNAKKEHFYFFRTILIHTGNEIRNLTKKQLYQFLEEKRLVLYQNKQNTYRKLLLTDHAFQEFNKIKVRASP